MFFSIVIYCLRIENRENVISSSEAFVKLFSFFTFLFFSSYSYAGIQEDVQSLIKTHHLKSSSLGMVVVQNNKTLFELNSSHKMVPASLTKIVTAGAVLDNISLDKKFKTQLLSNSKGDLCLKGGGKKKIKM